MISQSRARLHEGGRGDRRARQEVPAAHVAPPQFTDLLDRPDHRRRELQADARGEVLAVGHADLVDRDRAAELAAERLRDDARRPAARLLAAQPPGDGRLVVAQVEAPLGADHVDAPGQPGVRASGFLDERLQPFVRLTDEERPGCHELPPDVDQ
ncbi:UNVERIFIED_CONTAM: hypothetical protein RKD43_002963 [Streptomyces graminofaciens]